jgi:hypothetical protein
MAMGPRRPYAQHIPAVKKEASHMKRKGLSWEGTTSAHGKGWTRLRITTGLLAVLILLTTGCASGFVTVAPQVPEKFEKLGPAKGTACGTMLFSDGPGDNFLPVMLNSRVERAYQSALDSVPSSRWLTDVTMQEEWYWWIIGTTRCVTITGEAIR